MDNCKSFNFIIDENSEILILGSMPSVKSLSEKQYYAHPKNRFWKVMGLICDYDLYNSSYERKIEIILKNRFAIWDVIKTCKRKGSLDSNIQNEIPNEIDRLLEKYKNIKTIILNGNKAYQAFKKYFPEIMDEYDCYKLPSTSPANAKFKLEDLYKIWHAALNFRHFP